MNDPYNLVLVYAGLFFFGTVFLLWRSVRLAPTVSLRKMTTCGTLFGYSLGFSCLCTIFVFEDRFNAMLVGLGLTLLGALNFSSGKLQEQLIKHELARCELKPSSPEEERRFFFKLASRCSVMVLVSLALSAFFYYVLIERFWPLFLDEKESFLGTMLFAMIALLHLIFLLTWVQAQRQADDLSNDIVAQLSQPEIELLRGRIAAYAVKDYTGFVGILVLLLCFYGVLFSTFAQDMLDRADWRTGMDRQSRLSPESRKVRISETKIDVNLVSANVPDFRTDNSSVGVIVPLGFLNENQDEMLCSEIVLDILRSQLRTKLAELDQRFDSRLTLEFARVESDHLVFVLQHKALKQHEAFRTARDVIFLADLDLPERFEEHKRETLKRLETEKTSLEFLVAKLAPASASQVLRFGRKRITVFEDLENMEYEHLLNSYKNRLEKRVSLLAATSGSLPSPLDPGNEKLFDFKAQNEPLPELPEPMKPVEHRAQWDLPYRAVCDFWPLPDPVEEDYLHASTLFLSHVLNQYGTDMLRRHGAELPGFEAIGSGVFHDGTGLRMFVVTLWSTENDATERLFGTFETEIHWKTLKNHRNRFSRNFAVFHADFYDVPGSAFAKDWGAVRFRYGNVFKDESQYWTLAQDLRWLGSRSLPTAMKKSFPPHNRTRVVLEPMR